jgi:hypothetical protein
MFTKLLAGLAPGSLANNLAKHLTVVRQQLAIPCSG